MFKKRKEKKEKWKPKSTGGKIWYFIWYDDSILSWAVNIILAFVLIKFIVYPGLGFLLGTQFPIVAVISGSMDHDLGENGELCNARPTNYKNNFDNWWSVCGPWYENIGITKTQFRDFKLHNGFSKGDIIVLKGREPENIEVGDTIVFTAANPNIKTEPIIHRVVRVEQSGSIYRFQTKGDHNPDSIENAIIQEKSITPERVLGEAWFRIPWLGYLKIWFVDLINVFR